MRPGLEICGLKLLAGSKGPMMDGWMDIWTYPCVLWDCCCPKWKYKEEKGSKITKEKNRRESIVTVFVPRSIRWKLDAEM